jgi:GTP-binding protein HflX
MTEGSRVYVLALPSSDGASLAWLHEHGEVLKTEEGEEGTELAVSVRLSDAAHARFMARE